MAVNHHTYCKDNYYQMLVGTIAVKLKDGVSVEDICSSDQLHRRYGTVDILKAFDTISLVYSDMNINMDSVAKMLGLEYRPRIEE